VATQIVHHRSMWPKRQAWWPSERYVLFRPPSQPIGWQSSNTSREQRSDDREGEGLTFAASRLRPGSGGDAPAMTTGGVRSSAAGTAAEAAMIVARCLTHPSRSILRLLPVVPTVRSTAHAACVPARRPASLSYNSKDSTVQPLPTADAGIRPRVCTKRNARHAVPLSYPAPSLPLSHPLVEICRLHASSPCI